MLWTLQQMRLEDGTPVSGFFDGDPAHITDWRISTTAFTYTPDTSIASFGPGRSYGDTTIIGFNAVSAAQAAIVSPGFDLWVNVPPGDLFTRKDVSPLSPSPAASGEYSALFHRHVIAGCLVAVGDKGQCAALELPIPEPSSALIMLGTLMLAVARLSFVRRTPRAAAAGRRPLTAGRTSPAG